MKRKQENKDKPPCYQPYIVLKKNERWYTGCKKALKQRNGGV